MSLAVIEGGKGQPRHERPVVIWNRAPVASARVALVIRDNPDPREPIALAYDDGRPWLIGIRCICLPADQEALAAWLASARADGLEVRDERTGNPLLMGQTTLAQRIELKRREREARRDNQPLDPGGLFDQVRRDTRDLF